MVAVTGGIATADAQRASDGSTEAAVIVVIVGVIVPKEYDLKAAGTHVVKVYLDEIVDIAIPRRQVVAVGLDDRVPVVVMDPVVHHKLVVLLANNVTVSRALGCTLHHVDDMTRQRERRVARAGELVEHAGLDTGIVPVILGPPAARFLLTKVDEPFAVDADDLAVGLGGDRAAGGAVDDASGLDAGARH